MISPTRMQQKKRIFQPGCDNRPILAAACDRHQGEVDVERKLKEDGNLEENETRVVALFGDNVFHRDGHIKTDGLEDQDVYVEFGDDPQEAINKEICGRIGEARQEGLCKQGEKDLRRILNQYQDVFRLGLGSHGPARVPPMKIVLDDKIKPVRSKVRRYSVEQRKFLNNYMSNLCKMGCLIPNAQASWQAAPHLVPKDSPAKFRMTIDLLRVSGATKQDAWSMPNIESELSDFSGSKYFASLDFCAEYCQCPLDPESYDACGIIAPEGSFIATRV